MSWHTDAYPELRSGPPWVMQEMIAAQPAVAEQMLANPSPAATAIADEISAALAGGRPVTVTGCGTSEHAAHAVAALIAGAVESEHRALVRARPAMSRTLGADMPQPWSARRQATSVHVHSGSPGELRKPDPAADLLT